MKRNQLKKRLSINKKTIANLISTEMNGVRGGVHLTFYPWHTCAGWTCGETCGETCDCVTYGFSCDCI